MRASRRRKPIRKSGTRTANSRPAKQPSRKAAERRGQAPIPLLSPPSGQTTLVHFILRPENLAVLFLFAVIYTKFIYSHAYELMIGASVPATLFVDLRIFYSAAQAAFTLDGNPYDPAYINTLLPEHVFPFLYPPIGLLQFYPYSFLTFEQAKLFSIAMNHLGLLALIYVTVFHLLKDVLDRPLRLAVLATFVLLYWPITQTIRLGQVNIMLTLALMIFFVALRSRRDGIAGMVLAVAVCIKTYPVLLALPLLMCQRVAPVAYAFATGVVLVGLTLVLMPFDVWMAWFTDILPKGGYGQAAEGFMSPAVPWNQGLNGVFAHAFIGLDTAGEGARVMYAPAAAKLLTYASTLVVLGITVAAILAARRRFPGNSAELSVLLFLPVLFLISPLSWNHHTLYLMPTLLLLLIMALDRLKSAPVFAVGILGVMVLLGMPLPNAARAFELEFLSVLALWLVMVGLATGRLRLPAADGIATAGTAAKAGANTGAKAGAETTAGTPESAPFPPGSAPQPKGA